MLDTPDLYGFTKFLSFHLVLPWVYLGQILDNYKSNSAKIVSEHYNLDIFLSNNTTFFAKTKKASPYQCLQPDKRIPGNNRVLMVSQDLPYGQDFLQCSTELHV